MLSLLSRASLSASFELQAIAAETAKALVLQGLPVYSLIFDCMDGLLAAALRALDNPTPETHAAAATTAGQPAAAAAAAAAATAAAGEEVPPTGETPNTAAATPDTAAAPAAATPAGTTEAETPAAAAAAAATAMEEVAKCPDLPVGLLHASLSQPAAPPAATATAAATRKAAAARVCCRWKGCVSLLQLLLHCCSVSVDVAAGV